MTVLRVRGRALPDGEPVDLPAIRRPGSARTATCPGRCTPGPWIAQIGQFFDGWGRRASHAELPAVAAAQAQRTGWAKLIVDWEAVILRGEVRARR